MNKSLLEKLKTVKLADLFAVFLFLLALPIACFYKRRRPHLWLLCEYGPEARDNAYFLFRYLRTEHPEVDAVYALNRDSIDMDRVRPLGEGVAYGSLKHWIYYLAAEVSGVLKGSPARISIPEISASSTGFRSSSACNSFSRAGRGFCSNSSDCICRAESCCSCRCV